MPVPGSGDVGPDGRQRVGRHRRRHHARVRSGAGRRPPRPGCGTHPSTPADAVLAAATGSAITTADFTDGQVGLPVVEARRTAANDEAWAVHVLLATTAATGRQRNPPDPIPPAGEDGLSASRSPSSSRWCTSGPGPPAPRSWSSTNSSRRRPGRLPRRHRRAPGRLRHADHAGVGLTVQAIGWDEETSRGVGMLMAHLRNAPDESVPEAPRRTAVAAPDRRAGALRADLVQPRSTPTVHDSQRAVGCDHVAAGRRGLPGCGRHHHRGPADPGPDRACRRARAGDGRRPDPGRGRGRLVRPGQRTGQAGRPRTPSP